MKKICIISILMLALFQSISYAQIGIRRKVFSPTFSSVIEYQSYEKSIDGQTENISQLSFPTIFKMPVTKNIVFDLISSAIISSTDDNSLSGLRDVKARAVATFADDTLMLTAGVSLPSGRGELTPGEELVSLSLMDRAMGFRYSKLGEGFDINLGCGTARVFGNVAFGAGIGYLIKGEYEYLENQDSKYKAGNQLNFTGGFDLSIKPLFFRTDVIYTMYGSDELDGSESFEEGSRVSVDETAVLSIDRLLILLAGRYTIRGESKFMSAGANRSEKVQGNQLNINGLVNWRVTDLFSLKLLGDSLFIGENDRGHDDATVFGFGGGMSLKFMRRSFINLTAKYHIGSSDRDSVDLKGLSTTAVKCSGSGDPKQA